MAFDEIFKRGVVRTAGPVRAFSFSKERHPPFDKVSIALCTAVKDSLLEVKIQGADIIVVRNV